MREQFTSICADRGIVKKTMSGPEEWQAAKDQLISNNAQLHQLFGAADESQQPGLQLSLDVICMDVTKHMRNAERGMTLAEAKNMLGINPQHSRQLRQQLLDLLAANNFVNKYESGNWEVLKQQWLAETGLISMLPPEGDSNRDTVQRAIQNVCRDYMKRWRDAQVRKDPSIVGSGRGPSASSPAVRTKVKATPRQHTPTSSAPIAPMHSQPRPASRDDRIDPSLLQAANDSSLLAIAEHNAQPTPTNTGPAPYPLDNSLTQPIAAYFRLHPSSTASDVPPIWLGALTSCTVNALLAAALGFPGSNGDGSGWTVAKIEGLVSSNNGASARGQGQNQDMMIRIDRDDELKGYLDFIGGKDGIDGAGGGKATFVVLLQ